MLVPSYNHKPFIVERMNSIYDQTYTWREMIIVDDCSNDGSLQILRDYTKDPRVTLIESSANTGSPFIQWLKASRYATSDYIWIAESDDRNDSQFLEKMVGALEDSDALFGFCSSKIINLYSEVIGEPRQFKIDSRNLTLRDQGIRIFKGGDFLRFHMIEYNSIPNVGSCLFRREAFLRASVGIERFTYTGDWYLYLQLMCLGNVLHLPDVLNYFRDHPNTTRSKHRSIKEWQNVINESGWRYDFLVNLGIVSENERTTAEKKLVQAAKWDTFISEQKNHNYIRSLVFPQNNGKLLLVGSGKVGRQLLSALAGDDEFPFDILIFDSRVNKINTNSGEYRVYGLEQIVEMCSEDDLVLICSFAFEDELESSLRAHGLRCKFLTVATLAEKISGSETDPPEV